VAHHVSTPRWIERNRECKMSIMPFCPLPPPSSLLSLTCGTYVSGYHQPPVVDPHGNNPQSSDTRPCCGAWSGCCDAWSGQLRRRGLAAVAPREVEDAVVVGAGGVGLAVVRTLAMAGLQPSTPCRNWSRPAPPPTVGGGCG
jgi:hypothetical protein